MAGMKTMALMIILPVLTAGTPYLLPTGEVHICPGEMQVFTCRVSGQPSPERQLHLEWRIHLEDSLSVPDVIHTYIPSDTVGQIQRNHRSGHNFTFNLTSSGSSSLVSTMTVSVGVSVDTVINTATVNCGQLQEAAESTVLHMHTHDGFPSSPMNLKQTVQGNSGQIVIQWNSSDAVDYYTIAISPLVVELGSSSTTPDTSIQFSVLYNQEYHVSVVASNCVGNSTPEEITFRVGYCASPTVGPNVSVAGNTSGVEGSQITIHCQPGLVPTEVVVANCTNEGRWRPDPTELTCKVDCGNSTVEMDSIVGWISDSCSTSEGAAINIQCSKSHISNITLNSVCTGEGKWKQDSVLVAGKVCHEGNDSGAPQLSSLFPPLCASLSIISAFTFLFGFLLGVLLTKCITKLQASRKKAIPHNHAQVPIYEEVPQAAAVVAHTPNCKVKDNVAYGPM